MDQCSYAILCPHWQALEYGGFLLRTGLGLVLALIRTNTERRTCRLRLSFPSKIGNDANLPSRQEINDYVLTEHSLSCKVMPIVRGYLNRKKLAYDRPKLIPRKQASPY
jgi:hypothetical protein